MGCVDTIRHDRFPKQGSYLGSEVRVCFHYDADNWVRGRVIRDDAEEPGEMLIALDEGRVVRAVECQWQPEQP